MLYYFVCPDGAKVDIFMLIRKKSITQYYTNRVFVLSSMANVTVDQQSKESTRRNYRQVS